MANYLYNGVELPESEFDLRSWLAGYVLGVSGRELTLQEANTEPKLIGYSYNGTRLPPLPDLDEETLETYPYVFIVKTAYENHPYHIYFNTVPFEPHSGGNDGFIYALSKITTMQYAIYAGYDEWTYSKTSSANGYNGGTSSVGNVVSLKSIIWSNYDIYRSTDDIYLPASTPVPVYE